MITLLMLVVAIILSQPSFNSLFDIVVLAFVGLPSHLLFSTMTYAAFLGRCRP